MRFLLLLILIGFLHSTKAQTPIGLKAGPNFGTYAGVDESAFEGDLSSIFGLQLGILCEAKVSEKIAIQPEFLFIQKGFRVTNIIESGVSTFKTKSKFVVNYLELPVMTKIYWGDPDEVRYFASIGPTLAYAASAYNVARVTGNGATDRQRQPADLDDLAFNRFELGVAFGGGINITLDPGFLFIEARYGLGLTNINTDDGADANYNRALGITLGYMVDLADVEN